MQRSAERVKALDAQGPGLGAVLETDPEALENASRLDAAPCLAGPLHGIPVLLKDNIRAQGLHSGAGSRLLGEHADAMDAPVTRRLREAGMLVMGKSNQSVWSSFISEESPAGWSPRAQTRNPHHPAHSASGSSSGAAAAVASGEAPLAVGTETKGSIVQPAAACGVVGFKGTPGSVPNAGVIPISTTLDTPGPLARSVRAAAALQDVLSGRPGHHLRTLSVGALEGVRLGVVRGDHSGADLGTERVLNAALRDLRRAGAELVDGVELRAPQEVEDAREQLFLHEFKVGLERFLAEQDEGAGPRSLAELLALVRAHPEELAPGMKPVLFERALATEGLESPDYLAARATYLRIGDTTGAAEALERHGLTALVGATDVPAPLLGARGAAPPSLASPVGDSRLPHLTVPMGKVEGMPVGLSFAGARGDDARVFALGYAYEQARSLDARPALPASPGFEEWLPR